MPNHVTFADGLFIIAATGRPVRFVIYSSYFDRPITGRLLRALRAIPISPSGGPKMILQAFREAGKALDAGELRLPVSRGADHPHRRDDPVSARARADRQGPDHADHPHASRPSEQKLLRPDQPPAAARSAALSGHRFDRRATAAGRSASSDPLGDSRPRDQGLGISQGRSPAVAPRIYPPGEKAPAPAGVRRLDDARSFLHQSPDGLDHDRAGPAAAVERSVQCGDLAAGQRWQCTRQPGRGAGRQGRRQPQLHGRPRRHGLGLPHRPA